MKDYANTTDKIQITDEEKLDKYHVDMMELYEKKIKEQDKLIKMLEL